MDSTFLDYLIYVSLLAPLFFVTIFKAVGSVIFDSLFYQFWSIGIFPILAVGLMLVGLRMYGLSLIIGYLILFFSLFLWNGGLLHPLFYSYFIAGVASLIQVSALRNK